MQAIYVDQPRFSFEAVTPADLVGKEFWPVEITAAGKIQLLASGVYLGVLRERLEGSGTWNVELRGRIIKAVANGSITAPAAVKNAASGFVAASSSDKAHGIALPIPASAISAGDIISVMVVDHVMP